MTSIKRQHQSSSFQVPNSRTHYAFYLSDSLPTNTGSRGITVEDTKAQESYVI
jgi:hypothetical protein